MFESPMDEALSAVLRGYRLTARVFAHQRLCDTWELNTSGSQRATFHLIGSGSCWLKLNNGQAPMGLSAGDLILFPHDAWHLLSGAYPGQAGAQCQEHGYTTILCGYLEFDNGQRNPLLESLPEMLRLNCAEAEKGAPLQAVANLLLAEAENAEVGRQAMLDRLSEALLVLALRRYLTLAAQPQGFFAALANPRLRNVLSELHLHPGKAWRVKELAELASMSRSAFLQRFTDLLGEPPLAYLTGVRMRAAALLLEETNAAVAAVAQQMGYGDEAAFRRAFKRVIGVGPGAVRRRGGKTAPAGEAGADFIV
jgi:AraC-like DNA-binding protein